MELFFIALLIGLSSWGFGRTFGSESLMEEFRQWLLDGPWDEDNAQRTGKSWFYAPNEHNQWDVEGDRTFRLTPNGYSPGPLGLAKGKLADLLGCYKCLGGQFAFWSSIVHIVFGWQLFLVPFAAVAIGYIIGDIDYSKLLQVNSTIHNTSNIAAPAQESDISSEWVSAEALI